MAAIVAPKSLQMKRLLTEGLLDAHPTLVGIFLAVVALVTLVYLVRRSRR
jgi:hypothetical protein